MTDTANLSNEIYNFAQQITITWRKAAAAIVETGQKLIEAKERLSAAEFFELKKHLSDNEGISVATLSKLQMIARHPILSQAENFSALPPSYTVLYRLTQADEMAVKEALENGALSSSLQMKDVEKLFFAKTSKTTAQQSPSQISKSATETVITINGSLNNLNVGVQEMLHKVLKLVALESPVTIEEV